MKEKQTTVIESSEPQKPQIYIYIYIYIIYLSIIIVLTLLSTDNVYTV